MMVVEKVTVNIGVGGAGEKLEKAKKLIEKMTGGKPVECVTHKRIPTWDIRKGLAIGAKTTLRGKGATDFLNKCLDSVDRKIPEKSFDEFGNFSFGVREYIDLPGLKYDPDIGMFGFDVCVTLGKSGYRIKKRKRKKTSIPKRHIIKKSEAIEFMKKNFNVVIS